jgi:hypothetical protein
LIQLSDEEKTFSHTKRNQPLNTQKYFVPVAIAQFFSDFHLSFSLSSIAHVHMNAEGLEKNISKIFFATPSRSIFFVDVFSVLG